MSRVAVVLQLMTPIAISSAMMAESVSVEVSPGMATMSSPTEQTLVMASSFSRHRCPWRARLGDVEVLAHRYEGAAQPADPRTGEGAALLDGVVQQGQGGRGPRNPDGQQPQTLKNLPDAVATCGVGARERSTTPKGIPRCSATSLPISSPTRVTL